MIRIKLFYNSLLLFLSVLVTLIFCELFYRGYVYFQKPLHKASSIPNLGWDLTPGAEHVEDNIEGTPITYLINSLGFRDINNGPWDEWETNDIKIAYIGDSVTWGTGVEYVNTYTSMVESTFKNTNLSIKTINLGIGGTNSLQHLAMIKSKVFQLNPNIIILGYFMNDINRRRTQKLPEFLRYILSNYHFGTFLFSRIIVFLENRQIKIQGNLPSVSENNLNMGLSCDGRAESIINGYVTTAWDDTKQVILSMYKLCRQEEVKFGVVIFPYETQVNGICPYIPQEMLGSFLLKNGIPFLDISKMFEKHSRETKLYLEGDISHLNNTGHRIAGKSISQWLMSEPNFTKIIVNVMEVQ